MVRELLTWIVLDSAMAPGCLLTVAEL